MGRRRFAYDLNGNLLSDGTRNFTYDDENQLISVLVAGAWSNNFVYDGKMRRRIERDYIWSSGSWLPTSETHFIYDGNVVVQERNANNLPTVTYTRGTDLSGTSQGAGGIGGLIARTDSGGSSFYHADGNGNVTMLVNGSGGIAAKYLYDSYGNMLGMWGTLASANTYRYASKEIDLKSGQYYYGYRYYQPNLQRWPNRDPIQELGGLNMYRFVGNEPTDLVDLYGLDPMGHHLVPKAIWKNMSKRVQDVWDSAKNRLDAKGYKNHNRKPYGPKGGNKVKCSKYQKAVEDKLDDFLDENDADSPEDLTDEQLQDFADEIADTTDGDIGAYNAGVAEEIADSVAAGAEAATAETAAEVIGVAAEIDEGVAVGGGAIIK